MDFPVRKIRIATIIRRGAYVLFTGFLTTTCFGQAGAVHAADVTTNNDVNLGVPSAVLMDASSGQILWSKNPDEEREPASTTKIMTLYLAEKAIAEGKVKKSDIVPITDKVIQLEQGDSSSGWLNQNEKIDLNTMLKLITVPSGNDAAEAVAEYLSNNDDTQFVNQMNQEAKDLGLTHTHYMDAHGLTDDPNHHTTARDLATLAKDLVTTYPDILNYTSIQTFSVNDAIRAKENLQPFRNTNELLGKYQGMDGLKTGFTDKAGYCLVATAKRGDMRLIAVTLGANSEQQREGDTARLLDYGFDNFKEMTVVQKGELAAQPATIQKGVQESVPTIAKDDIRIAIRKDASAPTKQIQYDANESVAPIQMNQKLGVLQVEQNGQVIATTDLIAQKKDDKASWIRLFFRSIERAISALFHKL